jgi:hypothetical protein
MGGIKAAKEIVCGVNEATIREQRGTMTQQLKETQAGGGRPGRVLPKKVRVNGNGVICNQEKKRPSPTSQPHKAFPLTVMRVNHGSTFLKYLFKEGEP